MAEKYILVIDEGTTGTRALVVDRNSEIKGLAYTEFTQYNPAPDRVEHDADEIWQATVAMIKKAVSEAGIKATDIVAAGITNQRATTTLWDRSTGKSFTRSIVWQDTRTAGFADAISGQWKEKFLENIGSVMNPAFSSLHLHWMMENVPEAYKRAQAGDLAFGTIDLWLTL